MNEIDYKQAYELLKEFIEKRLTKVYPQRKKDYMIERSVLVENYYVIISKVEKGVIQNEDD